MMRRGFLNKPGAFSTTTQSDSDKLTPSISKLTISENLPKSNSGDPLTREPTVPSSSSQQKTRGTSSKPRSLGWPIDIPRISAAPDNVGVYVDLYYKAGNPGTTVRGCRDRDSDGMGPAFCAWLSFNDVFDKFPNIGWTKLQSTPTSLPYRIVPVKGSGLGLVACRTMAIGEIINIERPVLIAPHWFPYDNMLPQMYETMMSVLDPSTVKAIKSLSNCKPVTKDPGSKMTGTIHTNAVYCPFPQSQYLPHYAGVFLDMSRCNHSCVPNATWEWDHCSLSMELRALRSIHDGEQITISYIDQWQSRSERQKELKAKYDFTCSCLACEPPIPTELQSNTSANGTAKSKSASSLSPKRAAIAASDARRKIIGESKARADTLWKHWTSPTSAQSTTKITEFHERVLQVRGEEGFHKQSEDNLAYLAHACAALGDKEGFRRWAKKLMELRQWGPGQTGLDRQMTWERWVEDPTKSPAWGLRDTGNN